MTDITQLPVPSFAASFQAPEKIGAPKSFLLYGETGTRKTSMIAELVKSRRFNRVLVFDINNGTEVFGNDPETIQAMEEGRLVVSPIDKLDPNAFQVIESRLLETAGVFRDPNTDKLHPWPDCPDYGFDLVVLDTFNDMQKVAAAHFLATTYNERGALDSRKAYGKLAVWSESIINLYHGTDRFVGAFILHPKVDEEKTGGAVIKPQLQGSFKDSIGSIPSLVAYLDYEKNPETSLVELTATVGESELAVSKNRYRLPSKIRDFSMVKFYDLIDKSPVTDTSTPAAPSAA